MIRRLGFMTTTAVLLTATLAVAQTRGVRLPSGSAGVAGMKWVTPASSLQIEQNQWVNDAVNGRKPLVQLEAVSTADSYPYAFTSGEQIDLVASVDANGYTAPVTMYLYRQNRTTGTKQYYNVLTRGFAADESVVDLFGTSGSPVAINVPSLQDFRLFGTAGALGLPQTQNEIGRYQWVLELRDASGRQPLVRGNAMYAIVNDQVALQGDITTDRRLTADNAYLLKGAVFVRSGATLTIDPGTVIFGEQATIGTLIVAQGGRIEARGTRMQPIIMSSDQPVGERARSDWGGLIINGRAPINRPGGTGTGEGNTGVFGGTNPQDDSGTLHYVRVEFAGREFSPDNELNGIAFQGTGSGTEVDYIQVHFNKDDGVEFFGGTTNAKHLLLTNNADDSLDWTDGWVGDLQYVAVVHSGEDADTGIEADNLETNFNALPRSNPRIYNATFIGDPFSGNESNRGVVFRRGTGITFRNSIVAGFKQAQVSLRDSDTFAQVPAGLTRVDNNIFFSSNGNYFDRDSAGELNSNGQQTRDLVMNTFRSNQLVDPMLTNAYEKRQPNLAPMPGSPALDANFVATPPDNGFFDTDVDFIGAVGPADNWVLSGWATFARD